MSAAWISPINLEENDMSKILAFVLFVATLLTAHAIPAENLGSYMHVVLVFGLGFMAGGFIAGDHKE